MSNSASGPPKVIKVPGSRSLDLQELLLNVSNVSNVSSQFSESLC